MLTQVVRSRCCCCLRFCPGLPGEHSCCGGICKQLRRQSLTPQSTSDGKIAKQAGKTNVVDMDANIQLLEKHAAQRNADTFINTTIEHGHSPLLYPRPESLKRLSRLLLSQSFSTIVPISFPFLQEPLFLLHKHFNLFPVLSSNSKRLHYNSHTWWPP